MPVLELWHGTNEDFGLFDTSSSLGVHFGTSQAAAERLASTGRTEYSDGDAAVPRQFAVSIANAIGLHDLGIWSFQAVLRQLQDLRIANAVQVDGAYEAWNLSDAHGWKALKDLLHEAGYDGVRYINQIEDAGSESWIAFEASQIEPMQAPRLRLVNLG